jgi:uncharacterized protein YaaQ
MPESTQTEPPKQDLLIAVVQGQDADMATQVLEEAGFGAIHLPSIGAFLGRKNATLMIGAPQAKVQEAMNLLNKTCRQRVAFIAVPMENAPLPMPAPTPITIGGANVFSIEVDHFEEF